MPSPDPLNPLPQDAGLDVRGAIPSGLSGRLVGIGRGGVVHSVHASDGLVSYSGRRVRTEAAVRNLVAFGGSILAFGDDSPAYELRPECDALRRVDLAGQRRSLTPYPKPDAETGGLHLIARDTDGVQAHVVVSAGALTRHSRTVVDAPGRIHDFSLTRDHLVLVADGVVGVASRAGESRPIWMATGIAAPHPVLAYEAGDAFALLALTPLLERWTLHVEAGNIEREVLDPTPRRFAHGGREAAGGAPRHLWTTGNGTIGHHELVRGHQVHRDLSPSLPGDFVFVADATRACDPDGGWLVGFTHDPSGAPSELRVIDAADIVGPAVASVPIPCPVPRGLRCTWIPSTQQ